MTSARFEELTAGLGEDQWWQLAALACEPSLAPSLLERGVQAPLSRDWLAAALGTGLLVDAGVVYPLLVGRGPQVERALALAPGLRAPLLRRFAEAGQLQAVRAVAGAAAGRGSCGGIVTALYAGDAPSLERALRERERSTVGDGLADFARDVLREMVTASDDDGWLERTWGEDAWLLVEQALADALPTLEPLDGLDRRLRGRAPELTGTGVPRQLAEHALLRGDLEVLDELGPLLPTAEQLALGAAAQFLSGDLDACAGSFERLRRWKSPGGPPRHATSVTVLLALVALSQDTAQGASLARKLMQRSDSAFASAFPAWPQRDAPGDVFRALRGLLRRRNQPQRDVRRLSPHQLPAQAHLWVVLLHALGCQLQPTDRVTRAAWARRLSSDGERVAAAGYAWFARQLLALARDLDAEQLPELPPGPPGEPSLSGLIEPEPEWQRALTALTTFAKTAERREMVVSRRVAWYVDMVRGALAKPALEEFLPDAGWSHGRRVSIGELVALEGELPPEDVAVLRSLSRASARSSLRPARSAQGAPAASPGVEALDALCGHPRVFNGARGRLPVEVVRGTCRLETRREHGHLVVRVEPAGASEGVNVAVESESRIVVYRADAMVAKLVELLPTGLRVPEDREPQVQPVLASLAEHVEIRGPALGAQRSVTANGRPCLRISPEAGAWWVEIGVRPFGPKGRFFPPGLGRRQLRAHAGGALLDTLRDLEAERAAHAELVAGCPTLAQAATRAREEDDSDEPVYSVALGEEALLSLLVELRESQLGCDLEWKKSPPMGVGGQLHVGCLHGSLRRVKGWYLATGGVALDEVTSLSLEELVCMPHTKSGRFIRLPSGDFVEVERRMRQVLAALRSSASASPGSRALSTVHGGAPDPTGGSGLRVPETAWEALRTLSQPAGGWQVDPAACQWLAQVEATLASEPPAPVELRATLRPYQLEGFRWLWRFAQLGAGVCLADDMGLGKTVEAIALLLTRAEQGPALVVAPTSVCRNWLEEIRKFAPSLSAVEYVAKGRSALLDPLPRAVDGGDDAARPPRAVGEACHVVITSYALLQQDARLLAAVAWDTVVLDEAQMIKNARSQRARAACGLTARHRVVMTGTPVENHLGDLWSLFHFAQPELLGSWKGFQVRFLKPVERDHDSDAQAELRSLVQPFLLRRRKDDVLRELPKLTVLHHEIRLSEEETLRYGLLRRQIHEKLRTATGKRQNKLQILAELTRLRRFCCHPRLVFPDAGAESSKVAAFLELALELRENGHRALVFSQYVDFLQLVREELDEHGFDYLYLDGSTSKDARHQRVQAFQEGEGELFLISLKAGGFGVNLTAADYVIHLDPWWNPAVEAQATDRAHRIGQRRPVTVYRLITRETIEESIVALHEHKRALADGILEGPALASELDQEQLLALLGVSGTGELGAPQHA